MIVSVLYTDRFLKSVKKLPIFQQEKLAILLELLKKNPFAPQLHGKPLSGVLAGLYSFRITREWRVVFQFLDPQTIRLINAGHRKDIYR